MVFPFPFILNHKQSLGLWSRFLIEVLLLILLITINGHHFSSYHISFSVILLYEPGPVRERNDLDASLRHCTDERVLYPNMSADRVQVTGPIGWITGGLPGDETFKKHVRLAVRGMAFSSRNQIRRGDSMLLNNVIRKPQMFSGLIEQSLRGK